MDKKNTIVLIPSYQPEDVLPLLAKALFELGFKLVVVDDGSGEKFAPVFKSVKPYADLISYPNNKGKGAALKTGFSYIIEHYPTYENVITADGDGQHRIQDIVLMYEKGLGKNKPVIGERKFDVKVPLKSKVGNDLSKFTQALCTFRYMHDNQCGLRLFPLSLLPKLIKIRGNRYEYEMRVLTYLQTKEIRYLLMSIQTIYEEGNKSSHFRPLQDTLLIQSSILAYGLVNFISFLIGLTAAILFSIFVFKDNPLCFELSILVASPISLLCHIAINSIVFRPSFPARMIIRLILYEIVILSAVLVTVTIFSRVLNLYFVISYLISYPLMLFPFYYLIKGVSLVYNSQYE